MSRSTIYGVSGPLVPLLALLACGKDAGPSGPTVTTDYVFREALTDQADEITCNDRGTISIASSGTTFTGTLRQTGGCSGPGGDTDNSGTSTLAGGRIQGTTIQFDAAGCHYVRATVGDPMNGASGAPFCTFHQGGQTFTFSGEWHLSSGVASVSISPDSAVAQSGDRVRWSGARGGRYRVRLADGTESDGVTCRPTD